MPYRFPHNVSPTRVERVVIIALIAAIVLVASMPFLGRL